MFRAKTVFILGAGSSHEVGLPVGDALKETIAEKINIKFDDFGQKQKSGDSMIMAALRQHVANQGNGQGDPNSYLRVAWQLREALPHSISIDNLLEAYNGDEKAELCGKLGIVKSILDAEGKSSIYFDPSKGQIDFKRTNTTWLSGLVKLLTEGVSRDKLDSIFSNISFINFNYDRCLEHYLFHALKIYYSVDEEKIAEVLDNLKVYRPYGKVGSLPWQSEKGLKVQYGMKNSPLIEIVQQIKTFNEQLVDHTEVERWQKELESAELLVFLGFAFHRQNMVLLDTKKRRSAKRIYATAWGISKSDCETISNDLRMFLKNGRKPGVIPDIRNDLKCENLFTEYWRSLTSR